MKKITLGQVTFTYNIKTPGLNYINNQDVINQRVYKILAKLESLSYKSTLGIENVDLPWQRTKDIVIKNKSPLTLDEKRLVNVKAARENNIKNMTKDKDTTWFSHEVINNIYQDLTSGERENILPPKAMYRKNDIYVGSNKLTLQGFVCLNPDHIQSAIDKIINLANDDQEDDHIIKKALLIMTLFVYVHPYPDFNGRMSRLLKDLFLQKHQVLFYAYIIDFVLKINEVTLTRELNQLRFDIYNKRQVIDLDTHLNSLYKWFFHIYIYLYEHLELVDQLSELQLQILLVIILKTKTTNQKDFHWKEIENILKLETSKVTYFNELNHLTHLGLLEKVQTSGKKVFYQLSEL